MSNLAIHSITDMQTMALAVAQSGLFGVKTKEQALALMLLCQAEGMHPMIAARDYHIIDGRPSLKADAMLARFQQSGGKVAWQTMTDEAVVGVFSHPQGGEVTIDWTMLRAKTAQLGGKGNWLKYPRQMLRARVISEGIRATYPACCVGVYTPEEVMDFESQAVVRPGVVTHRLEAPAAPSVVVEAPAAPDPAVGLLEGIAACDTIADLDLVGCIIKARNLKGAQATVLRSAFRVKREGLLATLAHAEATAPGQDDEVE